MKIWLPPPSFGAIHHFTGQVSSINEFIGFNFVDVIQNSPKGCWMERRNRKILLVDYNRSNDPMRSVKTKRIGGSR